jgi:hypothetical protein
VPDGGAAGGVERRVVQGDLDAGLEGAVEGADAVGGEEEDAGVVFEGAEEDWVGVVLDGGGQGGGEGGRGGGNYRTRGCCA